jgi:sugar O-acyltransferase (sialic acid O-acetyltransferase NeuD family)
VRLLIGGSGGHGRVVADAAALTARWSEIAFLDDRYPAVSSSGVWPVVGCLDDLTGLSAQDLEFLAAVGEARLRLDLLARARAGGFGVPVLVHPKSAVSPHAQLGPGVVVFAGGVVNVGAELGTGCLINTAATVDHDCHLDAGVHVCPGAHLAGDVSVGMRTWFGIGAVAKQGIRIGADVTVGAGAVCLHDIRDGATVAGVPAKEMPK